MDTFFELIQLSVGTRDGFSAAPPSAEAWWELFREASRHGVLGVTFPALAARKAEVPREVYLNWLMAADTVSRLNRRQRECLPELQRTFREGGFRTCLLKGQAAATLYPDPLLRQAGDIDIWVEGPRDAVVAFLRARYPVRKVVYHHCDVKMAGEVGVEAHFTPSWRNGFLANRKLQRWFAAQAGAQFSHFDGSLGCNIPTRRFNGVYLLLHMFRHLLDEGVGLRPFFDCFFLLRLLTEDERNAIVSDLRSLRLLRFAGAVMHVLREVFAADAALLLCPPDPRAGAFLLGEVLRSGNFGLSDERNAHAPDEGLLAHGVRKLRRNLRMLSYYPAEVLAMPFFMTWQYAWRCRKGYLYKGR